MADLPKFHSPKEYLDLARSPAATAEQLRALAASPYDFVLEAVAGNRSTPPDVLAALTPERLDGWNDSSRLLALIRNPTTPTVVLEAAPELILPRLHARDDQRAFEAGVALAQRPGTPEDRLVALVEDPRATTEFRKVVARETIHSALRERLLSDRSDRVRRAAERPAPTRADTPVGPLAEAYNGARPRRHW
jgi:hypothetical protein